MKRFFFIIIASLVSVIAFGQAQQFAWGAVGGDTANAGTVYYYINNPTHVKNTKATTPIKSQVTGIFVVAEASVAAARVPDSVSFAIEQSWDNTNWVTYPTGGATTPATQVNYSGTPVVFGTNSNYQYVNNYILARTSSATGGGLFLPKYLYAPYVRIKCVITKASTTAYIRAYATFN